MSGWQSSSRRIARICARWRIACSARSTEAEDAVQEAWLRLSRSDTSAVENLSGWLTTVVARVCLDMLRTREVAARGARSTRATLARSRRASGATRSRAGGAARGLGGARAARRARDAGAGRAAWRSCCTTCSICRSTEIAPIVGRSPDRGASAGEPRSPARAGRGRRRRSPIVARQREVVDAFLAASRGATSRRCSRCSIRTSCSARMRQPCGVGPGLRWSERMLWRRRSPDGRAPLRLALIDGAAGFVWSKGGEPKVAFRFTIEG